MIKTFKEFIKDSPELLNEDFILGKGEKYGQVVFVSAGAGSGKDYVLDNIAMANKSTFKKLSSDKILEFIPKGSKFLKKVALVSSYISKFLSEKSLEDSIKKEIESWVASNIPSPFQSKEELKTFIEETLPAEIKKNKDPNKVVSLLDLKSGKNVEFLRLVVRFFDQYEDYLSSLFSATKSSPSGNLPNLAIEIIGRKSSIQHYIESLESVGYQKENISLIWVVTSEENAQENNQKRSRSLLPTTIHSTHKLAANELSSLFEEESHLIEGEIWIVYNSSITKTFKVDDKETNLSPKEQFKNWESKIRKHPLSTDVSYVKIKEKGNPIWSHLSNKTKLRVTEIINHMVPERVFNKNRYSISTSHL
jgi:hypothetical protein